MECWLGSFVIFQGIWTSTAEKPYIFVIFLGGGVSGPPVPPLDPLMFLAKLNNLLHHHFSILSLQLFLHGRNMANVYESIEKSMLPVEYLPDDYEGPNAGTVDQIVGAYFF